LAAVFWVTGRANNNPGKFTLWDRAKHVIITAKLDQHQVRMYYQIKSNQELAYATAQV